MTEHRYSSCYCWLVVLLLTAASTLSYIDRQILALMVGPVKRDIGISDTEISLLIGLAFTLLYSALMVPMGWLADRYSRRTIIGVGIFSWSAFTVLCGMARNYTQLFLARMGVGVGEATLAPAAYSMLSDYFPREKLPLAISLFTAAPFIGVGLANILGGPLVAWLEQMPPVELPLLGTVRSWQLTFVVVGVPGLLLAFFMLAVREPLRAMRVRDSEKNSANRGELLHFLKTRRGFLGLHFIGFLLLAMQGYALFAWVVELFIREHQMGRAEIGIIYGVITLVVGLAGSVVGGFLAGRMMQRGRDDAPLLIVIRCALLIAPLAIIMPLVDDVRLAIALLVPVTFIISLPPGLSVTALQVVLPDGIRAQTTALYLLAVTMVAVTLGPLIVGVLNDYVFYREEAIGKSLAVMAVCNYLLGALSLFFCLKYFRLAQQALVWEKTIIDNTVD